MPGPTVELAQESDIPAWLTLAAEVDALFGEVMSTSPQFRETLLKNIARGSAYCVRLENQLAGAMLYRNGWIHWLAVGRQYRHRGVGSALVQHTQDHGEPEIRVTTFGDGHPHSDAAAAQRFYKALGFEVTGEPATLSPDGTPRIVLLWRRET